MKDTHASVSRQGLVPVLELLHSRQEERGFLAEEDVVAVARVAGVSPAELYGAITAYPRFHLQSGERPPAVCSGPACFMNGAPAVRAALGDAPETHCLGLCDQPVAVLTPDGARIVRPGEASPGAAEARDPVVAAPESAFFGPDDPLDALRSGRRRAPEALISAVAESGLEGRGGAGFPAGTKWEAVRGAAGDRKFVVCNADESEPGSFKDRTILDRQPRRLLAGMALAAHAAGASSGVIYIRYEYRAQYEALLDAIRDLRAEGRLGKRFDVTVCRGAGSYVCGEETALLSSLEGRRPVPRDRPPYPVTAGLLGAPTLVHNVETLAAVPAIIARGGAWYRELGRPKLYCVSGDVPSPGVFELPVGTTARDLVRRAGTSDVKAFTLGGLSGGLLPASALDVRLDFEDPARYGAHLGSGGVVVLDGSRCIVRFTLQSIRFFAGESCGKCFPCRIGTVRLREWLEAAARFETPPTDEISNVIDLLATGSACGLGPAAGLVASHLLRHFEDEVRAHGRGRCPAGECDGD